MSQQSAANEPANVFATGRDKLLGHLAMLLFAALIAGSFSLGHKAAPFIGPAALNAIRFALATALMAGIAWFLLPGGLKRPTAIWRYAILGGLMATYFILMFVALRISEPVPTGAVFTLMPLMTAGFGWIILGQRTRPIVLISSCIGACGAIWLIFRADFNAILSFDIGPGEAIFAIGCAAHAAYVPFVRKFRNTEPVIIFTVWTLAATTIWIFLFSFGQLVQTDFVQLPAIVWWAIAYLAVFTTAGTFFLLQFASLRLPASKVLSYGYLTPAFIILIEGFSGHGWASIQMFAGAAVIGGALVVMAFSPDG
ncbi:MAG: DMT family transporter [Rhizobiaceae bacterium]